VAGSYPKAVGVVSEVRPRPTHYLHLPVEEVACILDIPLGTAKSRIHRGLATLRGATATPTLPGIVPAQERSA
jgi:hypothetical protein